MIEVLDSGQAFHLSTPHSSYVVGIFKGLPVHYFWGSRIDPVPGFMADFQAPAPAYSVNDDPEDTSWSSARLDLECALGLAGDLRSPSLSVFSGTGPVFAPRFAGYRCYRGRPRPEGLPVARATDKDAETLELTLADEASGLRLLLSYTLFENSDVISRMLRLVNDGTSSATIREAASFCLDFSLRGELDLVSFDGSWARERLMNRRALGPGRLVTGSRSGASGHRCSPGAIVARPWTTEDSGEAFSCLLSYSGSWAMSFERDEMEGLRWTGGINPDGFSWHLDPGESFDCPEALLCYSESGLAGLSRSWHEFILDRVIPQRWNGRERPVLINNWEATYFSFDEKALLSIAGGAARLGVELFVLDDGWFGKRNDDRSGLGDWQENPEKLPGGLGQLATKVRSLGLKFGLWVEPESVSPDSDLYRKHPDWCLHHPGRPRATGRNQLLLDLGRQEVRTWLIGTMKAVFSSCRPDYVKWDMNRHLALAGSAALSPEQQGESRHRHILGVYQVMEALTDAFPEILFEGCAGGGGRMDPGILHYMPQFWTSDDTDAFARTGIQYGTSFFFPPVVMGSHVSAVPNHQTGRNASMRTRFAVASGGNLGYELDPTRLTEGEAEEVRKDIEWYKERRKLFQYGRYYRLEQPFGRERRTDVAWMTVAKDCSRAVVTFIRQDALANPTRTCIRLKGLDVSARYRVSIRDRHPLQGADRIMSGSELLYRGYEFQPWLDDGWSLVLDLARV